MGQNNLNIYSCEYDYYVVEEIALRQVKLLRLKILLGL